MSEREITRPAELFGRAACARRFKTLDPLPVSGFVIRIRSLTEREKSEWESEAIAKKGDGIRMQKMKDAGRRLIQRCAVDDAGNPFITDAQREEMADWDSADTAFLYDECAKHCGVKQGELEDIAKNSETARVVS